MGQKVSPIGYVSVSFVIGNQDGMQTKIMPIYYWKTLRFVNSYSKS